MKPYTGTEKSLVIGIDIGTTLSGVSYALLEPEKVPRISPVIRFLGQPPERGNSKVPSVVCYDQEGHVIAVGPETDPEVNPTLSAVEGVRRAEWFKLPLRLPHLAADRIDDYREVSEEEDEEENDEILEIEGIGREVVEPEFIPRPVIDDFKTTGQVFAEVSEEEKDENNEILEIEGIGGEVIEHEFIPRPVIDDFKTVVQVFDEVSEEKEENNEILEIEGIGGEVVEPEFIPRPVIGDFKTAVQVFTDFLQYLFKSAKEYIIDTEKFINPTFTWSSIERNTHFILAHPNGWEGKQQSQMREAAVAAALVDSSTAADHITFVTEGEASLHFCLDKNPELHQEIGGLLVVDCGGGTIDLSAYSQTKEGGYKEVASPDCLLQGSIFVTSRARDYFKRKFKGSQFGTDDDVEAMARSFDKPEGAKCSFSDPNTPYYVKFGGLRDTDKKYGITHGKFKLEGAQVAKFFEPAVKDIIDGIMNQRRNTKYGVSIKHVLLVGGFGRSDYLYAILRDYFKSSGIVVLRPDGTQLNKAVADGSVSWYLNRYVSTRDFGS